MAKIVGSLALFFLFTGTEVSAETVQDTLARKNLVKEIFIEEIAVKRNVGVITGIQQEKRANLQMSTDKVLEHIPGVQIVKRGNFAWEPTVRSLNAGQINITIDGMHIFGACTDRMDPISAYVEPANLQSITLNLSPDFGNYGGSIGGGIDFKLKDAQYSEVTDFRGMIGTAFESNASAFQTLGSLEYRDKRLSVLINGIIRKAGNYKAADKEEILYSQYRKWNGSLSAGYKLNESHELQAAYIQDEGRDIGYPALTMDVAFANAKIASLTHHYHLHNTSDHRSGHPNHLLTKVYYNFVDHAMDDTKRPEEQVPMHMDMPGKSQTAGFLSEAGFSFPHGSSNEAAGHVVDVRLSGYLNRLTADMTMYPDTGKPMYMLTLPDAQRSVLNLDISDNIDIHDRLRVAINTTLSFGRSSLYSEEGRDQLSGMLQGQDPDRNLFLLNLNLRGRYQFAGNWDLSAHIGRTSRSASLQEYYGFYIFNRLDGYDYLGNHNLAPEKAINANVGVNYSTDVLQLEVNTFAYLFSDYIAGRILPDYSVMTIGAAGVKRHQNIGKAKLYGAELALNLQLTERMKMSSANTYTRGADDEGHALPLVSPFVSVNTLFYEITGYSLRAEMHHYAAQNHISFERYGETPTPASTLLDLGIRKTYRFKRTFFTVDLQVENIFDRYYHRHLDIMKIARPGRNIVMGLMIGF